MVEFIPEYDSRTVEEVTEWLETTDVTLEQLTDLRDYEQANDDRTTLLDEIEGRIEDREEAATESEPSGGDTAAETDAAADTAEESSEEPPVETVVIRPLQHYCAGRWFDTLDQTVEVERTTRVEQALDAGECELADGG